MKKILLVVLIATASFQSILASNDKTIYVAPEALSSFQNDFILTSDVKWEQQQDIYIVNFTQTGGRYTAYYNTTGELLGYGTIVAVQELPLQIQQKLQTKFTGGNITQAMKYYPVADKISYFISVETSRATFFLRAHRDGSYKLLKQSKK